MAGLDELITFEDDFSELFAKDLEKQAKDTKADETVETDDEVVESDVDQVEEDVQVEETVEDTTVSTDDSQATRLQAYFDLLNEEGVLFLPDDYKFNATPEGLQEAITKSREAMPEIALELAYEQMPSDEFKFMIEYVANGGTDFNVVRELNNATLDLTKVDIEDTEDQKRLLKAYMKKTTKYDDNKINKLIGRYEDLDELEEEAEEALKQLKKINEEEKKNAVAKAQQEKKAREQAIQKQYKEFVETTNKLEGVSETAKKKIVSSLYEAGYGENGNISYFTHVQQQVLRNPEHLAQLANIFLNYDEKKGFKELETKIVDKEKKKITSSFREKLDKAMNTDSKGKVSGNTSAGDSKSKKLEDFYKYI